MGAPIVTPNPHQFVNQYAAAPFKGMVFATESDRTAWLTNTTRYAQQLASDLENPGKLYQLNATIDAWLEVSGSGAAAGADQQLIYNNSGVYAGVEDGIIDNAAGLMRIGLGYVAKVNLPVQPARLNVSGIESSLGPEEIDNGTFTGDISGWTAGTGWAYGGSNNAFHTPGGSGAHDLTWPGTLIVGATYRCTYTYNGNSNTIIGGNAVLSGSGTYTRDVFISSAPSSKIVFHVQHGDAVSVTNVSIKRIIYTAAFFDGQVFLNDLKNGGDFQNVAVDNNGKIVGAGSNVAYITSGTGDFTYTIPAGRVLDKIAIKVLSDNPVSAKNSGGTTGDLVAEETITEADGACWVINKFAIVNKDIIISGLPDGSTLFFITTRIFIPSV